MKKLLKLIKSIFGKNKQTNNYGLDELKRIEKTFETLHFWTPELIEWIGNTTDPILLASTGHLVNCHQWPDYLPSKPNNYESNVQDKDYSLRLYFCVELYKMLVDKAEKISPGLPQKIWLTYYYDKFKTNNNQSIV